MLDNDQMYLERVKAWERAKAELRVLLVAARPWTREDQSRLHFLVSEFISQIEEEFQEL